MWHCKRPTLIGIFTLVYLSGVALFFLRSAAFPGKIACPTAWLAIVVFGTGSRRARPAAWALLYSTAGDAAGALHLFLLQIAFFAAAHLAYIRYFLREAHYSVRRMLGTLLVGGGALLLGLWQLLPHIDPPAERTGVALYAVVIAAMLASTLLYRGRFAAGFRCAALLFIGSDAMIGWDRFVEPISCADPLIMGSYYAAQYLFALLALLNGPKDSTRTVPAPQPESDNQSDDQ